MTKSLIVAGLVMFGLGGNLMASPEMTERAKKFVAQHEKKVRPLDIATGLAWWNANVSGKDEDFAKKEQTQNKIDEALADRTVFKELKALKEARDKGEIDDKILAREIDVLFLIYLEKQVDPKLLKGIAAKANAVEQKFNVCRAKVDGKEMTDSEVRNVLKNSDDSSRRKAVWEACKVVGSETKPILEDLVAFDSQAAWPTRNKGFPNFHAMYLPISMSRNGKEIIKLFDELDELTREPFAAAKRDIDERLAKRYGIKPAELMPWHYHDPFFQEAPAVYTANLDAPFAKGRPVAVMPDFLRRDRSAHRHGDPT